MCLTGCTPQSSQESSDPGTDSTAGGSEEDCCETIVIESRTVATQPSNRARTDIGIGEEVELTTDPSTSVTWRVIDDDGHKGVLSTASGSSTIYTACDRGKTVSIEAECSCGKTATIVFNVVQMSGGTLENPIDVSTVSSTHILVGFDATPTFQPTNVSFAKCEFREGVCLSTASGVFADIHGIEHHETASWVPCSSTVGLSGTALTRPDNVTSGNQPIAAVFPPGGTTDGHFHWPIPWRIQVRGSTNTNGEYVFATLDHINAYTASTRILSTSKGGQSVSRTVP